jgi:DNA modification methylase
VATPYYSDDLVTLYHGDARALPLADNSVDLIVTSPPYFGLRSYTDGGEHYTGQIGAEASPREFIAALIECTREMVRVLKPSGSIFVNLGDKYAGAPSGPRSAKDPKTAARIGSIMTETLQERHKVQHSVPTKSLMLLPERYRIAAVDELGLIARAVLVWSKPNGLPESVTDRVRRSHEDWVHLTKSPKYFAAVDEIREPTSARVAEHVRKYTGRDYGKTNVARGDLGASNFVGNPLGKLPGSVWEIATQPLRVPAELGVDHFAAFPMEWPRRLIQGWCPREVCTACGEGRRPVVASEKAGRKQLGGSHLVEHPGQPTHRGGHAYGLHTITGYTCDCPDTSAPATPGVVLDPFSGTGTTALVAAMLGRQGIGVDASHDYCRLAEWRVNDPKQRERASRPVGSKPRPASPLAAQADTVALFSVTP